MLKLFNSLRFFGTEVRKILVRQLLAWLWCMGSTIYTGQMQKLKTNPFCRGFCSNTTISTFNTILKTLQKLKNCVTELQKDRQITQLTNIDLNKIFGENKHFEKIIIWKSYQSMNKNSYGNILAGIKSAEKLQRNIEQNIVISGCPQHVPTEIF